MEVHYTILSSSVQFKTSIIKSIKRLPTDILKILSAVKASQLKTKFSQIKTFQIFY